MISLEDLRATLGFDPMTGHFYRLSDRTRPLGRINSYGYAVVRIFGTTIRAHRLAWLYHYGEWPTLQIDHINGIRSDNRIANLRLATNSQNQQNAKTRKDNTSGFRGVYFDKSRGSWTASIRLNGRYKYLGSYATALEARQAYEQAASEFFGAFYVPDVTSPTRTDGKTRHRGATLLMARVRDKQAHLRHRLRAMRTDVISLHRRPIPGYEPHAAGDDGCIYSPVKCKTSRQYPLRRHTGFVGPHGYLHVGLKPNSQDARNRHQIAVHRLVALAFLGPPPDEGAEVRHLNGDKLDNSPHNLAWGSKADNGLDRRRHGIFAGINNPRARLDERSVRMIRTLYANGVSRTALSERFKTSVSNVNAIVTRASWATLD